MNLSPWNGYIQEEDVQKESILVYCSETTGLIDDVSNNMEIQVLQQTLRGDILPKFL